VLTVKAAAVALQFTLGALQFAAFLANPGAIMLAAFFADITAFFLHAVDIVAQLGAGDTGLCSGRQAQPGDQGKGNQFGIHGYSPEWNGMWRGGMALTTSRKMGRKA
jgi:hypothetical protein